MKIEGKETVEWTFTTANGTTLTVKTLCYYVPECKTRLLSPQRLFNKAKGIRGKYTVEEDYSTLQFEGVSPLIINYNSRNWLPAVTAWIMGLWLTPIVQTMDFLKQVPLSNI